MDDKNSFGLELKARRELLGLSIKRLAKISGVSRRWIVCAEQSRNISMDVLRKLMQAMKMTGITLCPGIAIHAGLTPPDTEWLTEAVEDIGRSNEFGQQAADRIKAFITLGVGKSAPKDSPENEGFNERAAALVNNFTEHVRSLSDPDKLQKVEKAVSNFLKPEAEAPRAAKALTRRRRSSA